MGVHLRRSSDGTSNHRAIGCYFSLASGRMHSVGWLFVLKLHPVVLEERPLILLAVQAATCGRSYNM